MNSTWKRLALAFSVFFFALGSPLNILLATDYFVSGTGDDANDGLTSGTPFRTITRAMQGSGGGLVPGDRVLVAAGAYDTAAGEVFPIPVADGITILGPGDGTAVVTGSSGGSLFLVGSLANTTVLQGLTVDGGTNATTAVVNLVFVGGNPADLRVLDNQLVGGNRALDHPNGPGGPAGLVFQGNTISGSLSRGLVWTTSNVSSTSVTGPVGGAPGAFTHSLTIDGNTFNGIGLDGIQVNGFNGAFFDISFQNNVMDGFGDDGIDFNLFVDSTGLSATGAFLVENNTIRNAADKGLTLTGSASETSGVARADLTFRNNVVEDCGTGLELSCTGTSSALGEILGLAEFNTFNGNSRGINVGVSVTSAGTASFHPTLRYNCIAGATDGMVVSFWQEADGLIDFAPRVYGNLFLNNTGDDARLETGFISSAALVTFNPDFGGGGVDLVATNGLNIFEGKNPGPGPGGNFDFEFGFGPPSFGVPARGNWWGTFTGSTIEAHVFHNADSSALGTVDFGGFLNPTLKLQSGQKTIQKKGGERLTVTAGDRSAFLAQAGNKTFAATLNGIPVINPVISPDHTRITFTTPDLTAAPPLRGTSTDDAYFLVSLPGGTVIGSLTYTIAATLIGGRPFTPHCFLTTAAYGDRTAPEIGMFRRWRDESLAGNPLGRQLVRAYYAASPPLAEYVAAHPPLRAVSRAILAPVLGAVRLWMDAAWVYGLAGLFLAWRLLRRGRS